MAKKRKAKRSRVARQRKIPRKVSSSVATAIRAVRTAKAGIPGGKFRAAWRELHRVESELSRLGA